MLAAVVTLAGVSTPAAYGFDATASPAPAGGQPAATLTQQHPAGSSDLLIGVGTAGGIALVAGGLAASLRSHPSTPRTKGAGAASGS